MRKSDVIRALLSEAVSPGFDFADMTLARREQLATDWLQFADRLHRFCPP